VSPNAVDIHSLVGLCQSFHLTGMLILLRAFESAPSETGIADMRALLATKRQRRLSGEPISPIGSCTLGGSVGRGAFHGRATYGFRRMCANGCARVVRCDEDQNAHIRRHATVTETNMSSRYRGTYMRKCHSESGAAYIAHMDVSTRISHRYAARHSVRSVA